MNYSFLPAFRKSEESCNFSMKDPFIVATSYYSVERTTIAAKFEVSLVPSPVLMRALISITCLSLKQETSTQNERPSKGSLTNELG
jgi:hypothetical protein